MRFLLLLSFCLTGTLMMAQTVQLKNAVDSASYAYGVAIGNTLQRQMPAEINKTLMLNAMRDALDGKPTMFDMETAQAVFGDYMKKQQSMEAEKGMKEGKTFLDANQKRPEVKTTASGLQYEVLRKGPGGPSPAATDKVTVHYHGTNIDGSVFDSSVDRGSPATFGLNQVIKGWTEGLQLMQVGDKYKFYLPADLAYGERSPSPKIKAYAALIFEVELISIEGK
ncbi:MAG: FKBP-type peptidyl-prolyl cis-trans isomerase [Saprospiraceae bacterium]